VLVRDGRILGRNLRAELMTKADLLEQLREQGIDDVKQVKACRLEGDGRMSVIRKDTGPQSRETESHPKPAGRQ
jgi:uncharacterized membrane protein YcaP (DUF421 family)